MPRQGRRNGRSLPVLNLACLVMVLAGVGSSVIPQALADGVYCGSSNQVCPMSAPICCGADIHFCVAAGYKCCGGENGDPAAMCRRNQECCPDLLGGGNCCDEGYRCTKNARNRNECVRDACSVHSSQESCLYEQDDRCGWCCAERKCVSLTANNLDPVLRGCAAPPLKSPEERCSSRCYQADTCSQCTRGNTDSRREASDEECAWCCATMTCMPSSEVKTSCVNEQYTLRNTTCHGCYAGGTGASARASSSLSLYPLLSSLLFIITVAGMAVAVRLLVTMITNTEKPTALEVQESIRRYGFDAADAQPSSPIIHHRRPIAGTAADNITDPATTQGTTSASGADGTTREASFPHNANNDSTVDVSGSTPYEAGVTMVNVRSTACAACKKPIRLADLEAHLTSVRTGTAKPNHPLSQVAPVDGMASLRTEEERSSSTPQQQDGNAGTTVVKDDPAVIFLPCGHCCCYKCAGVPLNTHTTTPSAVTAPSPPPAAPTIQPGGEENPPAPSPSPRPHEAPEPEEPTIEQVLAKKRKNKCPACKAKFTDVLFTNKVRSI